MNEDKKETLACFRVVSCWRTNYLCTLKRGFGALMIIDRLDNEWSATNALPTFQLKWQGRKFISGDAFES